MRRLMNVWPPLAFAGVRVVAWDADYGRVVVRSGKPNALTANAYGTQFGGTLYAMTDPWYAILVNERLGREYNVWDQRGEIDYVAPGRGAVTAEFTVTEQDVEEIRAAASGEKVLRWFETEIVDSAGGTVARVRKQIYVRRKRGTAA